MTATEDLRRMLDERGAKWHTYFVDGAVHTTWNDAACWFTELEDGTTVWGEAMEGSPADAIEATLGRGACHDKNGGCSDEYTHGFECTVCEATTDSYMHITTSDEDEPFNFCPNCGRRVRR